MTIVLFDMKKLKWIIFYDFTKINENDLRQVGIWSILTIALWARSNVWERQRRYANRRAFSAKNRLVRTKLVVTGVRVVDDAATLLFDASTRQ